MRSFFDSRDPEQREEDDFKEIILLLQKILALLDERLPQSNNP